MTIQTQILSRAARHASLLIRACCYCPALLTPVAIEVEPQFAGVSHGACAPCRDRVLAENRKGR